MITERMQELAGLPVNEAKKPKKVTYSVRSSRGTTKTLEDAVAEITDLYPDAEVEMSGDRVGKSVTHDIYDGRGMSIGSVVVYESINEAKSIDSAIKELIKHLDKVYAVYRKRMGYTDSIHDQEYDYTMGQVWTRIYYEYSSQKSVWGFVNNDTGDIYFPAGWKAPAKKSPVRGNVHDKSTWKKFDHHSPGYMRR